MTKIIRTILRTLLALFLVLGVIVVATGVYCYHYRTSVIQNFISELNNRSNNSIQISSIQLTMLKSFPNITLILRDVIVKGDIETATHLITARNIDCVFDIWRLIQRQYVLRDLDLEHGKLHLGEEGLNRWLGRKESTQEVAKSENPMMVKLHKINLKDMEIVYNSKQQYHAINAERIQASVRWGPAGIKAQIQGRATIQRIYLNKVSLETGLPVSLKATLSYDLQQKIWALQPVKLSHEGALLTLRGSWGSAAKSSIALDIQGEKINPQVLLQCLPEKYHQKIKSYNCRGKLGVNLSFKREPSKSCALQGEYILRDGALTISPFTEPLELCQLSGRLSIPNVQDLKTASLSVDNMTSVVASSKLSGNLILQDFHNLRLQCAAQATLDLDSLGTVLAPSFITDASGQLSLHWELEANLSQLIQGLHTKDDLYLSGALQAQAVQFRLGQSQLLCKELMGNMSFKDNTIVMQDFSGSIGPGNFALRGTVQNLLPRLFSNHPKVCVDAKLYVDYLDLDILIDDSEHKSSSQTNQGLIAFNVAPYCVLDLDCDIQQLHFRRFQGKNVRGKIRVKEQKIIAEKLQFGLSGGKVFLDGILDASSDYLNIRTSAKLQDVQIASLFYMFENFHQNFLTDRHLSGEVSSDFDLTIQADKQWNISWEALKADIYFRLYNGRLYNFEPMQQLAKHVTRESLADLRFSEIKNHIFIKEKKIYLPPMEVHSNLTRIQLSGTHTFDGKIAYNFNVPFTGFQQPREGNTPEELDIDTPKDVSLFFKLRGYTNNYKISYDTEASRKSLKGALKKQGKILNSIVRGKYQEEQKHKELTQDDYFQFD